MLQQIVAKRHFGIRERLFHRAKFARDTVQQLDPFHFSAVRMIRDQARGGIHFAPESPQVAVMPGQKDSLRPPGGIE